jgi:hypothetical protein
MTTQLEPLLSVNAAALIDAYVRRGEAAKVTV